MKKILWLTLPLLLAFAGRSGLYGQTQVSGDILTSTVWTLANSPYEVTAPVRVTQTTVLTIEPGVVVRFNAGTRLDIDGTLQAIGSASDSIFFLPNVQTPDTGAWAGIKVNGLSGDARLKFASIRSASAALELQGSATGSHLEMENSRVQASGRALRNWSASSGVVRRCNLSQNFIGAENTDLAVRRTTFTGNDIAVQNSACDIDSCSFNQNVLAAIATSRGRIAHSLFVSNNIGLQNYLPAPGDSVVACQFTENLTAIVTASDLNAVVGNEICSNIINVEVTSSNDLSVGSNCWCTADSLAIQATIIDGRMTPGLGILNFFPIDSSCAAIQVVWPGDTDEDGVANIKDLLNLGVAFGFSGAPRSNASAGWIGQAGLPWDQNFGSGLNYKHADCDGNGTVTLADTFAIIANYGQTHNKTHQTFSTGGVPLYFDVPQTAGAGDTIEINVRLGDATHPALNAYGVSFELDLDPTVVQTVTASGTLTGTWLGTPGGDLIDLDFNNGDFAWGIVRTDQEEVIGSGRIGGVSIVMVDDLTRTVAFDSLFSVTTATLVNKAGEEQAVSPQLVPIGSLGPGLKVGPNPAMDEFRIALDTLVAEEVAIYDQSGQRCYRETGSVTGLLNVNAADYRPGLYLIRVRLRNNGLLTRKIYILK
ncbi:MAG: T9SS type A sorting domain-containing protein [Bacteroidota bacterium]